MIPKLHMTWLAAAITLAGCSFAPSTKPPAAPSPEHYAVTPTPADSVEAGGVAQHFDTVMHPVPDWWRLYGSDTLDAWVEEGLRNNASLDATRHTLEAAHQQFRAQVGNTAWPSLDAQGQASRQRDLGLPKFGPPTSIYNVFAGQLSLNYTFDLFGATRYGIKQAAAQVDQQAFQLDGARRALAANIVITAVNASSLAEQLDATTRLAALAHEQAELTEKSYALGAASHDDVLTAQQNAAALDASVPPLRFQLERTRHLLAVLMGRTPDQAPEPLPLAQLKLPDRVPVNVPSELLSQRPDVRAAEAAVRAASAQVGVATANMFPHVSLSASLGSASFKDSQLFTGSTSIWGVGLSLAQPIFHGGALRAQRKAAIAEYDASVSQYRQTVLNAFQNVADTLTALQQDALALQAAQAASGAAGQSHADTQSRYRLGAVSYPATLLSEQRWQNARLTDIQASAARLIDTAALYQAMGEPPEAMQGVANNEAGR